MKMNIPGADIAAVTFYVWYR